MHLRKPQSTQRQILDFKKTFISSILCVLMTCIYFFVEIKEASLKSAQRKDVFSFNVNEFLSVLCG